MYDTVRDSLVGQTIRWATKSRILEYPEETPHFTLPMEYELSKRKIEAAEDMNPANRHPDVEQALSADAPDAERATTLPDVNRTVSRASGPSATRTVSHSVTPTRTSDGTVLVDWYTTDDQENPQNWSSRKKLFVAFSISLYTFSVYLGSSIYVAGEEGIVTYFGVSTEAATLGLSLYVLAYGMGPMLWSPISEIPSIGRNPPYVLTFGIFVILCLPAALTPTFGGLLTVRFLLGFFGSPCLATGGASMQDMYPLLKLPYPIAIWSGSAFIAPALGPPLSSFTAQFETFRWTQWEILWLAGPTFLLFMFLPETSADTILLRRAQRLRKITGQQHLLSQSEIKQKHMTARAVAYDALVKPWQINFLDPAVLFSTFYTAVLYAMYYSFFESFPLVYMNIYQFTLGEFGLAFLSIVVALAIIIPCYCAFFYFVVEPKARKEGFGAPEGSLVPAMIGSMVVPVGLFLFAWTSRHSVHWIVSMIGVMLAVMGCFLTIQSIFIYVPSIYPKYAASLFAANDFARSALAAAATLWSGPMFENIGVGPGCSITAGVTIGCVAGVWFLFFFGANLRARSKFAEK